MADLIRAFTSASEVREKWMIEPKYLDSLINITKPPSARVKRVKIPLNVILLIKVNRAILKGHCLLVKIKKMHFAGIAFTMKMNSGDEIQCGNGI